MAVNVTGALALIQCVLPAMSHGGAIVNVTSGAAGRATWGAYSISKLALDGITGMLREELADRAIRCVAVNPGPARTAMRAAAYPDEDPATVPHPSSLVEPLHRHRGRGRPGPARGGRAVDGALTGVPGPIPPLAATNGWRDVPIEPVERGPGARWRTSARGSTTTRGTTPWGCPGPSPAGGCARGWRTGWPPPRAVCPTAGRWWCGTATAPSRPRPPCTTRYLEELAMIHADWPAEALEAAASRYVTPPSRTLSAPPPHLTGGAVDVTLGDGEGRALDLGTGFDAFVPEAAARALEGTPGPTRDLRRTLYWAMSAQGFTAYLEEWWHFDYGDQFWGLATGRAAMLRGNGGSRR